MYVGASSTWVLSFHVFNISPLSVSRLNYWFMARAKYVTGTVDALQLKPGGGAEWLASLRKLGLQVVIDALCTLPGVGPKVAACIALFSLDQHHAIPVDTHVWQVPSVVFNLRSISLVFVSAIVNLGFD